MRWLVGWAGAAPAGSAAREALRRVRPVGGRLLWPGPDPLWAVGDWRPDEIRTVVVGSGGRRAVDHVGTGFPDLPQDPDEAEAYEARAYGHPPRPPARMVVLGRCGAADDQLRTGLLAAHGGALRHLTTWSGSYTVVLRIGLRTVVLGDLAGVCPVFHTPWCGGTAYASAALPLADLIGALTDPVHLASRLAFPEAAEALSDSTAYAGVHRVTPGQALTVTAGIPLAVSYEAPPATVGGPVETNEASATAEVTRSLLEAVRCRVRRPNPPAPAEAPRVSTDLSGGSASTALTLLAATVPPQPPRTEPDAAPNGHGAASANGQNGGYGSPNGSALPSAPVFSEERWGDPRSYRTLRTGPGAASADGTALPAPRTGAVRGSWARGAGRAANGPAPVLAVTSTDVHPAGPPSAAREAELVRTSELAAGHPRLRHQAVPGGPETLPYAELTDDPLDGPLTDEPGPGLVAAARLRARLTTGGTDHLTGYGARQVLDGHPARLADLLLDRRGRRLVRPVTALARADGRAHPLQGALGTPVAVLRAARRLARTPYAEGLEEAAVRILARRFDPPYQHSAGGASVDALAWCVPGPAAGWLTDDALSAVAVRLRLAARRPFGDERPGAYRARLALHRHAADFRSLAQAAEGRSRLHAPFLDSQVVRAARLLPDAARVQPGARHAVLRAVLAGTGASALPEGRDVVAPPDPYAEAQAARAGLRQAAETLEALFNAPLLAEAGLIDSKAVLEALRAAAGDEPVALEGLADVIAAELWLRRRHARLGSCWEGLRVAERRELARG